MLADHDDGLVRELGEVAAAVVQALEEERCGLGGLGLADRRDDDLICALEGADPHRVGFVVAGVDEHEPVELRRDGVDRVDGAGVEPLFGGEDLGLGAEDVVPVAGLVVDVVREIRGLRAGAEEPVDLGEQVEDARIVCTLLGGPSEGAAGLVVVPGEHAGAAITGEHARQLDGGHGLADAALAVDDDDGAGAGPVLAHGADPGPFLPFGLGRGDADADAGEHAADAPRGGLFDFLAGEERLPSCTTGCRSVSVSVRGGRGCCCGWGRSGCVDDRGRDDVGGGRDCLGWRSRDGVALVEVGQRRGDAVGVHGERLRAVTVVGREPHGAVHLLGGPADTAEDAAAN